MIAKVILWFPVLLAVLPLATAEDPSFDSVEALERAYEEAMPDLLQGNAEGFDRIKQMAPRSAKAELEVLEYRFGRQSEQFAEKLGQPIDWTRLGSKTLGRVYRDSIYVCRYSKQPMFWCFRAYERNGRWWPDGFRYYSGRTRLFDATDGGAQGRDEDCTQLCNEIVDLLAQGKDEGADAIKSHFASRDPAKDAYQEAVLRQWNAGVAANGRLLKCELVRTVVVGGIVAEYSYIAIWERGTKLVRFHLYRAAEEWKILDYAINADYEAVLGKVAFEPARQDASPETARAAKPGAGRDSKAPVR